MPQARRVTGEDVLEYHRGEWPGGTPGGLPTSPRAKPIRGTRKSSFGYPGVQFLDRHFVSLPTTVHRGPGNLVGAIAKQLVYVGAHGNAYFALGYSDVPVNNQPCATASYLMIFAPNDVSPVVTYAFTRGGSIMECTGNINVSPVTAKPRYQ